MRCARCHQSADCSHVGLGPALCGLCPPDREGMGDSVRRVSGARVMKATAPARYGPFDLMVNPNFFGRWFSGPSWASWRVVLKVISSLPLDETEQALFEQ